MLHEFYNMGVLFQVYLYMVLYKDIFKVLVCSQYIELYCNKCKIYITVHAIYHIYDTNTHKKNIERIR